MDSAVISVTGMTCAHCVRAVSEEIGALAGVTGVDVNLDTGEVRVTGEPLPDARALSAAVADAGYQVAPDRP